MINKLRVGIPIVGGKSWLGGVSHMELHVKAVISLPRHERPQLFLIITGESLNSYDYYRSFASLFDGIIFIGSDISAASAIVCSPIIHCQSWDDLFTRIDFFFPVSFNVLPGRCAASWVHDFQHKHLPNFFPAQDIAMRDELCKRIADNSKLVFCSSRAVENDFHRFYPESPAVTKVLALRITPEAEWYEGNALAVQKKYNLPDEFILCSNQFWLHKNHRLLFEAIALLHKAGLDVHLVCTGLTEDFRCPGYIKELTAYIESVQIANLIHILGQIPRHDQIQLIRRSLFVVQPSLFEGLSLIVQECRTLGKPIILSDLEVHLEHEYGVYFRRTDVQDLADKIAQLLCHAKPGPDLMREIEGRLQAITLTKQYARSFCEMVKESQLLFNTPPAIGKHAPVLIGTSLRLTADVSSQRRAVDSWLKAGFAVVSLNRAQDIEALRLDFPDVTFAATANCSGEISPAPYINNILQYLAQSPIQVCGIVEPDICLYGNDLAAHIAKEAVNCLIFQKKTNIETLETFEGMAFPGVGCIFFDRGWASRYPSKNFRLDQPWWDYWLILLAVLNKSPVKHITTQFAYHITHAEDYDIEAMLANGEEITKYAPPPFALSVQNIARYQQIITQIINNHSLDIAIYGLSPIKSNISDKG